MAVTLTQAQNMLQRYLTAEQEVLEGRTVSFGGRTLGMADLDEIRVGRQEWERKVNRLSGGGSAGYKLATFE
ncbi:primosomal replication protein PriB/PriC domain protein [Pseudomonas sp. SO81]|uniref:primosomal replication protein PriB/PriC domain protein n=1 Tax=Pseudomonas sp. SO81 TaxID=2983246 RepID=UPI0025A47314|nr:primosomal replication protein PriB/PriC domain protein [Pseudomonas sp. SO81]WJN60927.1 Phage protein (ACLAME 691) [Pseudomonas sp. SO81]